MANPQHFFFRFAAALRAFLATAEPWRLGIGRCLQSLAPQCCEVLSTLLTSPATLCERLVPHLIVVISEDRRWHENWTIECSTTSQCLNLSNDLTRSQTERFA